MPDLMWNDIGEQEYVAIGVIALDANRETEK